MNKTNKLLNDKNFIDLTNRINNNIGSSNLEQPLLDRHNLIQSLGEYPKYTPAFDAQQLTKNTNTTEAFGVGSISGYDNNILYNLLFTNVLGVSSYMMPRIKLLIRKKSLYLFDKSASLPSMFLMKSYVSDYNVSMLSVLITEVEDYFYNLSNKSLIDMITPLAVIPTESNIIDFYFVVDVKDILSVESVFTGGWVKATELKNIESDDFKVIDYYINHRSEYPVPIVESKDGLSTEEAVSTIISELQQGNLMNKEEIISNFTSGRWRIVES